MNFGRDCPHGEGSGPNTLAHLRGLSPSSRPKPIPGKVPLGVFEARLPVLDSLEVDDLHSMLIVNRVDSRPGVRTFASTRRDIEVTR